MARQELHHTNMRRHLSLLFALVSLLVSSQSLSQDTTARLCLDENAYAPHLLSPEEATQGTPGFIIELVQQAAKTQNLNIEFVRRPWKRCIAMVQQNALDGLLATTRTPERELWSAFPENKEHILWPVRYLVFVHPDTTVEWDGKKFQNLSSGVAGPLGFVVTNTLKKLGALPDYHISLKKGLMMTARKRLDGYVVEAQIGWETARILGIEQHLKTLTPSFFESQWQLAFSKEFHAQNPEFCNSLWSAIDQERQKTLLPLRKKYQIR